MNRLPIEITANVLRLSNGSYQWDMIMYLTVRQITNILLDEEDEQD